MQELKNISKDKALKIAEMLLGLNLQNCKRGNWEVVEYSALGIESNGIRVMNEKNDYYVDFDFDEDEISVGNDYLSDDAIAVNAKTWFLVVSELNKIGIFHKWQPEFKGKIEFETNSTLTIKA